MAGAGTLSATQCSLLIMLYQIASPERNSYTGKDLISTKDIQKTNNYGRKRNFEHKSADEYETPSSAGSSRTTTCVHSRIE